MRERRAKKKNSEYTSHINLESYFYSHALDFVYTYRYEQLDNMKTCVNGTKF